MNLLVDAGDDAARHAQKLDAEAEFRGKIDVGGRDMFDAFDHHGRQIGRRAKGQAGKQRQLVRGVAAANIQAGIGLGIAGFCASFSTSAKAAPSLPSR